MDEWNVGNHRVDHRQAQWGPRNELLAWLGCLMLCPFPGCASWLPSGEEPAKQAVGGFGTPKSPADTAGVETILIRLNPSQADELSAMWEMIDEQVIAPDLRIRLDKNGMRAGKISGDVPPMLASWVTETVQRLEKDPLEQAGFAADVSSYSQLWRCRKNARKELTVRKLTDEEVNVNYVSDSVSDQAYLSPHLQFAIHAEPLSDQCARIQITPAMQYGELMRKAVPRESGIHMDTLRESKTWQALMIDLKLQQGDCLVIGPTQEPRGLGEIYLRTKTKSGEIQPVLLLVRLSELNKNEMFVVN